MKIYTRTGDNGTTSLVGGTRVSKASVRLEAYGTADELNSFVGLLRAELSTNDADTDLTLSYIQHRLFNLGTVLATEDEADKQQLIQNLYLTDDDVSRLEHTIDTLTDQTPVTRGFILPAGNRRVALCHVCRTIARRLERRMTELYYSDDNTQPQPHEKICLQFVNRLSDLLFVLSKKIAQDDKCEIFLWKK